jgi:hypothetical protein
MLLVVLGTSGKASAITDRNALASNGRATALHSATDIEMVVPLASSIESIGADGAALMRFDPDASQVIMEEDFEGLFPGAGWSVRDGMLGDGKENYWDDDDFRPYAGSYAAWPANGGADWRDPEVATYPYFANAWMTYGPFDLSNAKSASVSFMLWLDTETGYDFLHFATSGTGSSFIDSSLWSGDASWDQKTISLNQHLGDDTVWIAWQFTSDSNRNYEGPWVDDIRLSFEPRDIAISGQLTYADRAAVMRGANAVKAQLWDWDANGSDLLATAIADANGVVNFPTRPNWDADDTDPILGNRRLDPYIRWVAENDDAQVTNINRIVYAWTTAPSYNVTNSSIFLSTSLPTNVTSRQALWVFEDIQRARAYYLNQTNPQTSPGFITAHWADGQNNDGFCGNGSCFYAPGPYVFIAHASILVPDTIVHEIGHHVMWNRTGQWHVEPSCFEHNITSPESAACAWSEGWGDFFALAVNGDACYDLDLGPCSGAVDVRHFNLETHSRSDSAQDFPWGDGVEGRVAGVLYDLMDYSNESPWYDDATWGFDAIVDMAMTGLGYATLQDFWNGYLGTDKHNGVRSVYQNTIDYDQPPVFSTIPDQSVLQNASHPHFLELWAYSSDIESQDTWLSFQLVSVSDPSCGVTLDTHWVNANPQVNWTGSCYVMIRVSDTLKTTIGGFWLHVLQINSRVFLPTIMN